MYFISVQSHISSWLCLNVTNWDRPLQRSQRRPSSLPADVPEKYAPHLRWPEWRMLEFLYFFLNFHHLAVNWNSVTRICLSTVFFFAMTTPAGGSGGGGVLHRVLRWKNWTRNFFFSRAKLCMNASAFGNGIVVFILESTSRKRAHDFFVRWKLGKTFSIK